MSVRAVIVTLALYLTAACNEGNTGQVCTQPDMADCPSDNGGEVHP